MTAADSNTMLLPPLPPVGALFAHQLPSAPRAQARSTTAAHAGATWNAFSDGREERSRQASMNAVRRSKNRDEGDFGAAPSNPAQQGSHRAPRAVAEGAENLSSTASAEPHAAAVPHVRVVDAMSTCTNSSAPDAKQAPLWRHFGLLSASPQAPLRVLIERCILPWLLHPVGSIAVLAILLAAITASAIGAARLGEGYTLADLAPDGHYLQAFDRADAAFRRQAGFPVGGYFRGFDQSQPAEQRKMLSAWQMVLDESQYVSTKLSPPFNWLLAFQQYAAQAAPTAVDADGMIAADQFYELLPHFLAAQVRTLILWRRLHQTEQTDYMSMLRNVCQLIRVHGAIRDVWHGPASGGTALNHTGAKAFGFVQPTWSSHISLDDNGVIDLTMFAAIYVGDDGTTPYARLNLEDARAVTTSVNNELFAAENRKFDDGQTFFLYTQVRESVAMVHILLSDRCCLLHMQLLQHLPALLAV